jgi:hypothetical protein
MPLSEPKYHEILLRLADAGVEAIVVGMAAAVIQGAPTMTWDLDIVHHRTKDNIERLLGVLEDIDAVARGGNRRIRPNSSHLIGPGHTTCVGFLVLFAHQGRRIWNCVLVQA